MTADLEIRNLIAALAQHADHGEVADYIALFTDDAVWEMPANPAVGLAASVRSGRADIEAGVHDRRTAGVQGPGTATMHVISTVRIDIVDDAHATGHVYWQFYAETTSGGVLQSMGRYDDEYRHASGGWKLARRTVTMG